LGVRGAILFPCQKSIGFGSITVPVGFETDLASIPRALRGLEDFDPDGISRRPAAMHDWLYGGDRSHGKAWADAFLRVALIAEGMAPDLAFTWWLAVHEFGGAAWDGDRAKAVLWARGPLTAADKEAAQSARIASTLFPAPRP
jgi:hypothetical protein